MIKAEELWRESDHKSFPAYCRERWQLDASTVSHLIRHSEVIEELSSFEKVPTNEGQCRPLAS